MAEYTKREARDWAREKLRGQWSTLMTPFTPDDELDEDGLRRNIRHIRSLGTRGAGCTWGMGEFWSLTLDERLRVYDIVADEAAGEWPIAAHVTHNCYKDMLRLATRAERVGFDLLIVAPPALVTRTEDQVIDWVRHLADHTELAIMFYNSPQFGLVMSADGLRRLCEIHNVVGVKEASFDPQLSVEAHLLVGREAIISTPDEWIFRKGKEMDFEQQVMFANTSDWRFDRPGDAPYNRFIDGATRGELDEELYDARIRPLKELSDAWWSATVARANGALPVPMCKYWGELMGMAGGRVRPPHINFEEEDKVRLRAELEAALESTGSMRVAR